MARSGSSKQIYFEGLKQGTTSNLECSDFPGETLPAGRLPEVATLTGGTGDTAHDDQPIAFGTRSDTSSQSERAEAGRAKKPSVFTSTTASPSFDKMLHEYDQSKTDQSVGKARAKERNIRPWAL